MGNRWFPNTQAIECDLVVEGNSQALLTVQVPVVPKIGEELELDLPGDSNETHLYRVVGVRYHIRPRRLTMRDDLFGLAVYIVPAK